MYVYRFLKASRAYTLKQESIIGHSVSSLSFFVFSKRDSLLAYFFGERGRLLTQVFRVSFAS